VDLTGCPIVIKISLLVFGLSTPGIVFIVVSEIEVFNSFGCGSVAAGLVVGNMSSMFVVAYLVLDLVSSFRVLDSKKVGVVEYFFEIHFEIFEALLVVIPVLSLFVTLRIGETVLFFSITVEAFIILQKYWHLNLCIG